jgi:hypothetical protein
MLHLDEQLVRAGAENAASERREHGTRKSQLLTVNTLEPLPAKNRNTLGAKSRAGFIA